MLAAYMSLLQELAGSEGAWNATDRTLVRKATAAVREVNATTSLCPADSSAREPFSRRLMQPRTPRP